METEDVSGNGTDLASLFECPVCYEYVVPPIFQCQMGHIACSSCRTRLTCCPTCRGFLGNIRNLTMEKVASNVKFPCTHVNNGCAALLLHTEKPDHEKVCDYRTCLCPSRSNCKWEGSPDSVMEHLKMHHKSITVLQGEEIVFLATNISRKDSSIWMMMQSCFGHNFMIVFEKVEQPSTLSLFFALVQLIGSRKEADKFTYRLELNGNQRCLSWCAVPKSIHDEISSAFATSDCLLFDIFTAEHFLYKDNLGINVTICRV